MMIYDSINNIYNQFSNMILFIHNEMCRNV